MKKKYYKQFEKKQKSEHKKDWRHAFVEEGIVTEDMLVEFCYTPAIYIKECTLCTKYASICGYVAQFKRGGFWLDDDGLFFVTKGGGSDEEATYEDAQQYLKDVSEE